MKFGLLYENEKVQPWDDNSQRNAFMEAMEKIKLLLYPPSVGVPPDRVKENYRLMMEEFGQITSGNTE